VGPPGREGVDVRCDVTDLLVDECAHCRQQRPAFTARYDGHCQTCDRAFDVGESIRETAHGEYEHAGHRS